MYSLLPALAQSHKPSDLHSREEASKSAVGSGVRLEMKLHPLSSQFDVSQVSKHQGMSEELSRREGERKNRQEQCAQRGCDDARHPTGRRARPRSLGGEGHVGYRTSTVAWARLLIVQPDRAATAVWGLVHNVGVAVAVGLFSQSAIAESKMVPILGVGPASGTSTRSPSAQQHGCGSCRRGSYNRPCG
jgi:hypothetical protein